MELRITMTALIPETLGHWLSMGQVFPSASSAPGGTALWAQFVRWSPQPGVGYVKRGTFPLKQR
jgi:hypothetical protein